MRAWNALFHPLNERNGHVAMQQALDLLRRAREYAQQVGSDSCQFAVEINELRQLGLTNNDFRWLVARGCVAHALETTLPGEELREFEPLGRHMFPEGTCFILRTEHDNGFGESTAVESEGERNKKVNPIVVKAGPEIRNGEANGHSFGHEKSDREIDGHGTKLILPRWDSNRRELRVGDVLVKRFRWPAVNQETILAVFEEEGWPSRVDDPLPIVPEQDPKRRLHDTIKCLNRNQLNDLVHFRGDGTGEGVSWEFVTGFGSK